MKIKIWLSPNADGYHGKNKGVAFYNRNTDTLHGTAARTDYSFVEAEIDTDKWEVKADVKGNIEAVRKR